MAERRRFPPLWDIEEANAACFIVKDNNGQALAYPGRRTGACVFDRRRDIRYDHHNDIRYDHHNSGDIIRPRPLLPVPPPPSRQAQYENPTPIAAEQF
jgi:hypothetical protein